MKYIIPTTFTLLITFLLSSLTQTSPIEISGVVLDELGDVLIGAAVLEKGTRNGVATDIDGSFELTTYQLPVTLEISNVGYSTQTLQLKTIAETKHVEISLKIDTETLDEVVIVGMGKRLRKQALSQSTSVRSKPNNRSFIQAAAGDLSHRSSSHAYSWTNPSIRENAESYGSFQENTFKRPLDEALSTFSVDVDRASYSNIRRFLNEGQLPPTDAVRVEEMINYFKYDYTQPKGKDPVSITSTLTACPWNGDHQLLHIGLQAKEVPKDNLPPSNLVFLIDVSGSMSSSDKLPLVKASMKLLLEELRPADKVSIVTYAGHAGVVLEPTAASKRSTILKAINNLDSGGSTAGAEGIITAYQLAREHFMDDGNNRVLLATDGDFNVGPSTNDGLKQLIEKQRKSGIYLSILAYGSGNYQDDLMQTLAQAGNGNHAYIDNLQEAQKALVNEFGGTLFTVAKDVKVQIEFNPSQVSAYRLVGYESRMLQKEDFNNDKVDAGDMGSGHQVTAIYEIIPSGSDSPYLGQVDDLKYQKEKQITMTPSDDVATIKFRYKHADQPSSLKVVRTISEFTPLKDAAVDVKYSMATAAFGMKLRNSQYIDDLDFDTIIALAKDGKGPDNEGYRAEMIRLIRTSTSMYTEVLADVDGKE